jgi:peptidoglycan/LPS O-acetylase OafA/YrhL
MLAATSVLISHCYVIYDRRIEPLAVASGHLETLGGFSVSVFFIISGYLIVSSWEKQRNITRFIINRFLRIFPALIVAILFTSFILGPMATNMPWNTYWDNHLVYQYLKNSILIVNHNSLPGVFTNNPLSQVVNGSLWTLPVEFAMYIFVMVLGALSIFNKKTVPFFAVVLLFLLYQIDRSTNYSGIPIWYALRHCLFFLMGSFCFYYKESISWNVYWLSFFVFLFLVSLHTPANQIFFILCFPYMVLYLSIKPMALLKDTAKYGDFSYGMYIYAFPVSQFIRSIWPTDYGLPYFVLSCFSVTLLLAILSWHLIEKYALSNKQMLFDLIFDIRRKLQTQNM